MQAASCKSGPVGLAGSRQSRCRRIRSARPNSGAHILRKARPCSRRLQNNIRPIQKPLTLLPAVYRSLAYFEPADTEIAAKIEDQSACRRIPATREILSRIGDIYADRDLFAQAAPYWDRIPTAAPGESGGYLEAASIYWDYFDFDNALRLLNEGRRNSGDEHLYSYEAGAIYENQRDYARAIDEYVKGALAAGGEFARRSDGCWSWPAGQASRPG